MDQTPSVSCFPSFKSVVCYTYWRCLHLLMSAHYTAVYTKEILFTELPRGLLLPSVLQNIWTGISSLFLIWSLSWTMFSEYVPV